MDKRKHISKILHWWGGYFVICLLTVTGYAQTGPAIVNHFPGAPTGGCYPNYVAINDATGDFYNCLLTAWFKIGPAAAGVFPNNEPGAANNFLTAYNSTTGNFSKAQPACANLSDAGTGCSGAAYPGLPRLDQVLDPNAAKTFNLGANTLTFDSTAAVGGIHFKSLGGGSGHLFEVLQNTGNPSAGTHLLHVEATDDDVVEAHFVHTSNQASHQLMILENERSSPANNDEVYVSADLHNSANAEKEFGRMSFRATDVTSTSEDASFILGLIKAGSLTDAVTVDSLGTLKAAASVNAVSGFQVNGAAANGNCLVGDGTNFVSNSCASGFATTTLNNIGSVALSASLVPGAAATLNLGSATLPFANSFIGNAANKTFTWSVAGLSANRTVTVPNADSTLVVADTGAANNFLTAISAAGVISKAQPTCGDLSGVGTGCSGAAYPGLVAHNLLSVSHGDTTASAAVRGGAIFAVGASPTWTQVAHSSATGGYWKWNGTDVVASTLAAAGTGSASACTNQFGTNITLNADAAPSISCTTATLASAQFANQGTTTTVLHGNAAGNPAFGSVTSSDADATINGYSLVNTAANAMASAATDTNLAELSLAAGYLNTANKVIRVVAAGTWTTGTSQTPTWNFKIKLCTVSGCGSGTALTLLTWTSAASTASTTQTWILNGNVGTSTTGGAGTGKVIAHGFADLPVGTTANVAWAGFQDVNTAASAAIDLTAALFLELVANVSTQSGTKNSCTYHVFKLEP